MKKPPLVRKSAEQRLTVLNYGQIWNSWKPAAFLILAFEIMVFYIIAVLTYGRNSTWWCEAPHGTAPKAPDRVGDP